jgi:hypothetical protein
VFQQYIILTDVISNRGIVVISLKSNTGTVSEKKILEASGCAVKQTYVLVTGKAIPVRGHGGP